MFLGPSMTFTNDLYPRAENADWEIAPTLVKKGASIGEYAMVGAGAVVTKSVPPCTLVVGNPARAVGRICRCGHRLKPDGTCEVYGGKPDEQ